MGKEIFLCSEELEGELVIIINTFPVSSRDKKLDIHNKSHREFKQSNKEANKDKGSIFQ
ncbi:MAG: hypothetical protein N2312_05030 [Dictyoglomaceae bacterium]|nr:hypothetical protein [Dictyoglomaceae bacterium]